MDDKTQDQLMYEEAVQTVRESILEQKEAGVDFSKRAVREKFKLDIIQTATRLANDKRIFE